MSKKNSYFLKCTFLSLPLFLFGCGGSVESHIPYNEVYTNVTFESISCGRGNILNVLNENEEKLRFDLSFEDCSFLSKHANQLKSKKEDTHFSLTLIADGNYIDGIVLNNKNK